MLGLLDAHLLDLGGTYGDPNAADPIQYDELRIEHDQGDVEIGVYNRAILLFTTDSEAVRRIHRFTKFAAGSKTWRLVSGNPRRRKCSDGTPRRGRWAA